MREQIHLLLVDDHPVVIEGLKASLRNYGWINIVGSAFNGEEALEKIEHLKPEIVLLDIGLPGMNGIKIAELLQEKLVGVSVIIYTMYNETEYLRLLLKAGVKGFLLKDSSVEELTDALAAVSRGDTYFSPKVTGDFLTGLFNGEVAKYPHGAAASESEVLTSREREILILIAQGDRNKMIAERLGLNPRTVETHRRNIMMKLGIHSAAGLTRFAIEQGLV